MGHSTTSSTMGNGTAPSYLIVCFRYIGDVLVTTPLALSIKTAHPEAVVDYLVFEGTEAVLAKNPHVRKVITVSRNASGFGVLVSLIKKYDVAIAAYPSDRTVIAAVVAGKLSLGLTSGYKSDWWKYLLLDMHNVSYDRIHVVSNILMPLRMLGIQPIPRVEMWYDENDEDFAIKRIPFQHYIILHPYSMKQYKYWSAEKWAKLANLIKDRTDCIPVFTKTPELGGAEYLEQIFKSVHRGVEVFDSVCTLNQLAAIIKRSIAFVGVDTAITHIAAAMEVPTVAIFGPTLTRYWAPWPNGSTNQSVFAAGKDVQRCDYVTVVQKGWDCVPCNFETCAISSGDATECLEQLDEFEVLNALLAALGQGELGQ